MNGIKSVGSEFACAECNQKVSKDGKILLNFCPKCGNPLNIEASVKYENSVAREKTQLLYELLDLINDGADAVKQINEFIKELNS